MNADAHMHTHVCGYPWRPEKDAGSLELELEEIVSYQTRVLGTKVLYKSALYS